MTSALIPMGPGKREDWETPAHLVDAIHSAFGDIALDPCTNAGNPTRARHYCHLPTSDGLTFDWCIAPGLVYVNPPYGRAIVPWVEKIVTERERGAEILALVPARTDTRWFGRLLSAQPILGFVTGRVTFRGAPSAAPFPSVFAYAGQRGAQFLNFMVETGWVCRYRRPST